ncbi:MAG: DUF2804 domain-containing protein [Treponemataceae bacterium]|nr:DUF2804 domain-containing protein [Treponemataceae bacterium]
MKQHEIKKSNQLLNENGFLNEPGFAKHMLTHYNRENIAKSPLKIKEWDYYLVSDGKNGVALTIADNGYMGMLSVSLLDFEKAEEHTSSVMTLFPKGNFKLPSHSKDGTSEFHNKNIFISFITQAIPGTEKANRILKCKMFNFKDKKPFECSIALSDEPDDSMVIVTPYAEDKKAFYFNQKIIGMRADGWAEFDGKRIEFEHNVATGLLDWGRGVWTPENTWYWGAASGYVDGHAFGWNIGYGFGDTSAASENMLFYDGKAHKLDRVRFNIPLKDGSFEDQGDDWIKNPANPKKHLSEIHNFTEPWTFTSNDGRFEMKFQPIIDRNACIDFKILCSDQHQVFGKFTGKAILDDGKVIEIKDFFGFAEKVHNKW